MAELKTPINPTHVWRCEQCVREQAGPEYPGYKPVCPICATELTKAPIMPEQP